MTAASPPSFDVLSLKYGRKGAGRYFCARAVSSSASPSARLIPPLSITASGSSVTVIEAMPRAGAHLPERFEICGKPRIFRAPFKPVGGCRLFEVSRAAAAAAGQLRAAERHVAALRRHAVRAAHEPPARDYARADPRAERQHDVVLHPDGLARHALAERRAVRVVLNRGLRADAALRKTALDHRA